jgi:hypothetical protein
MISFHDMRRAMDKLGIVMSNLQLSNLMNEVVPTPLSGLSCAGATVWGDRKSIEIVKNWLHNSSTISQWREQVDRNQQRAMRAEELGLKLLNYVLCQSASNPASRGLAVNEAIGLLQQLGVEPRESFYVNLDDALADARTKFYDAAQPKQH